VGERGGDGLADPIAQSLDLADVAEGEATRPLGAPEAVRADEPPDHRPHVNGRSTERPRRDVEPEVATSPGFTAADSLGKVRRSASTMPSPTTAPAPAAALLDHSCSTTSSIITYQHTPSMTTTIVNALSASATYLFVAEGAFTLSAASVYEVRAAQNTATTGATTYLVGSYAMINKCSN
jgi:hypothetical protein